MTELHTIRCIACEGGIPALSIDEIKKLLPQIKEWQVNSEGKQISRRFTFKGFYKTMAFVNAIAWISHAENHHPDLSWIELLCGEISNPCCEWPHAK